MPLNEICRHLTAVNEMVSQWGAGAPISEIERDLVLEKLRTVYSQIKSVASEGIDCCLHEEAIADEPETANASEAIADESVRFMDIRETGYMSWTIADEPETANAPEAIADLPEKFMYMPETVADVPTDMPSGIENPLSDAVKKRKVLLSLYDQETVETPAEIPSETLSAASSEIYPLTPSETPSKMPPHIVEAESHASVLDEMNKQEQTLGDSYAQHIKPRDISTEIGCGHIETLSGAVGINDKFLMIRDMFDGDAAAYEAAMHTLESFDDLDDAMVYIYENYTWSPNSMGVTMLVDLLTRKLS